MGANVSERSHFAVEAARERRACMLQRSIEFLCPLFHDHSPQLRGSVLVSILADWNMLVRNNPALGSRYAIWATRGSDVGGPRPNATTL